MHFLSDTKWFLKQGFEVADETESGFVLLVKKIKKSAPSIQFNPYAHQAKPEKSKGLTVYYSNRCPFAEYHVNENLKLSASQWNMPLKTIKLDTLQKAQAAPSPATIFSLFLDGQFLTTDISICMESRFNKQMEKLGLSK